MSGEPWREEEEVERAGGRGAGWRRARLQRRRSLEMEGARGRSGDRSAAGRWAAGRAPRALGAASPRLAALAPPALAAVSPSFFPPPSVPKGKARSSPSPGAFRGPPPGPLRPGAGGAASGSSLLLPEAPGLSQRRAEAAALPQGEKLASPYRGAGRAGWCQNGCVRAAPRWPLRYTFESVGGRFPRQEAPPATCGGHLAGLKPLEGREAALAKGWPGGPRAAGGTPGLLPVPQAQLAWEPPRRWRGAWGA